MADVSFFIFQNSLALSPDQAGALLEGSSAEESVSSLAALRAGLQMEGDASEEAQNLYRIIDHYAEAMVDGNSMEAGRLRRQIARTIPKISPTLFSNALMKIARPSFSRNSGMPSPVAVERGAENSTPSPPPFYETIPVSLLPQLQRLSALNPFGLKRKADYFHRLGQKEESAYLYGLSAKGYAKEGRLSMSAHLYLKEGKIRLELGEFVGALLAFGRARVSRLKVKKDQRDLERLFDYQEKVIQRAQASGRIGATKNETVAYLFGESAKAHQKAGEKGLEGDSRYALSLALLELGQNRQAFREASLAVKLFLEEKNFWGVAYALAQKAKSLAQRRGNPTRVAGIYEKGGELFGKLKEERKQAEMMELSAQAFFEAKEYRKAAKAYERVFQVYYHRVFDTQKSEKMWSLWLWSLEKGGRYEEALKLCAEKAKEKERHGDILTKAGALVNMAWLYGKMGNRVNEILFYTYAAELYASKKELPQTAMAYGLASLAYKRKGDDTSARDLWKRAVSITYADGDMGGGATLGYRIGNLFRGTEDYEGAVEMYRLAIRGFEMTGDERLKECYEGLAGCLKNLREN